MKILLRLMFAASGIALLSSGEHNGSRWPVREQETVEKTLALTNAPMRVIVDNVDGYVHLTATNGSQVRVTAHKTIHAEEAADLQQAKSEVSLAITEQPGVVSVYYTAPWRCDGRNEGCQNQQRRFYQVTYDIDVEVPRQARPIVSTVNNGDIRIEGTSGDFDVKNVNGGISMTDVAGSGDVVTVNGPLSVRFAKNPANPGTYKSVNGQLDFYFQPSLSADLRFKTFNGKIYSDFDLTPLPVPPPPAAERRDGKFVYRSNGFKGARAGQGGPELTFDAFNGNILIHRTGATSNE